MVPFGHGLLEYKEKKMEDIKVEKVEAHAEHWMNCHFVHEHDENEIKKIQKAVNVAATGIFDATTHGAVTAFQNANELHADGVLTLETAKALKLK